MAKGKTCKGCAYMLTICKDGKVLGWCCELSDVPTTEDSEACTEFERENGRGMAIDCWIGHSNLHISKPNNDGERELIDRAVKVLEAEFATKTCNKQVASKLEDAELARDSEETCNNKQVTSKLVASDDTISRRAAIDAIRKDVMGGLNYEGILTRLPSVTPKQRMGHWIGIDDEPSTVFECDICRTTYDTVDNMWDVPNFCPNCGADMRESEEQA